MSTKNPKNIAASVRGRLLHIARKQGDDFQLVLTRYANERLLYRLSVSPHAERFVLKGATLFTLWDGEPHRATRDVDLLGFGDPSQSALRQVFIEALELDVEDDGVAFDLSSLVAGPIREDQSYGGVRINVPARISSAQVRLQVDVGFGDAITPGPTEAELPVLLDFPAPRLRVYPRETVVAEKTEAMVQLGMLNSRMKDFFDLLTLSQMFAFDGGPLVLAIQATFERRGTSLPAELPVALTPAFAEDLAKARQWAAFVRKSGVAAVGDLPAVMSAVWTFIWPPLHAAGAKDAFERTWKPEEGEWR